MKVTSGYGVNVDEGSIAFAEAAKKRAAEKHIDFGTAMSQLRAERDPSAGYSATYEVQKRAVAKGVTFADAERELRGEGNPTVISFADTSANPDKGAILVAHVANKEGAPPEVILAIGSKGGLKPGDKLSVKRRETDVQHPVTGDVIHTVYKPLGDIEVVSVDGASAIAKPLNAASLAAGDIAEPIDKSAARFSEAAGNTGAAANIGTIHIAHVVSGSGSARSVVLSDGANRGLKVGDRLTCSREELDQEQFKKTGMVNVARTPLGTVEVTEVQSTWAIAKPVNAPDLRTGDVAAPIG